MGSKMLPTIWGTYMKLVTKYQISAINSCWEKCDDEKCAYKFNVYKNQLSRQTGKLQPDIQIILKCVSIIIFFAMFINHVFQYQEWCPLFQLQQFSHQCQQYLFDVVFIYSRTSPHTCHCAYVYHYQLLFISNS
jgi:hypothetical protein